jgi:hypothetical protein
MLEDISGVREHAMLWLRRTKNSPVRTGWSVVLSLLLLSLLLFQIKHFLFDFVLQNSYQIRHKGDYLHPGGLLHAGGHALGSIPALWMLTQAPNVIAGFVLFEFVLHYHIDWAKAHVDRALHLNHNNHAYWVVFGADQFAHQLTYLGMAYAVLRYFPA